jgi:hypothetical protein
MTLIPFHDERLKRRELRDKRIAEGFQRGLSYAQIGRELTSTIGEFGRGEKTRTSDVQPNVPGYSLGSEPGRTGDLYVS